jgi:hypothetical protein
MAKPRKRIRHRTRLHAETRGRLGAAWPYCPVHDDDLPVGIEQIDVRLIDDVDLHANTNLEFVLTDTAR